MQVDMQGLAQRILYCNSGLEQLPTLTPFFVEGKQVGRVKPGFAQQLARFPHVFKVEEPLGASGRISLGPGLDTVETRSEAVAGVLATLRDEGVITGWRDELYPVVASFHDEPLLLVERASAVLFGIKAYGVHVNGFVRTAGGVSLWVARRSPTKPNWPNLLDHLAAGGQPHGLSCMENVVKECGEEAGVPEELAAAARPVGAVSYTTISSQGYKPDVLFCYDLELPASFVPQPRDGEVSEFKLCPVEEVAATVAGTTEYKPNCCIVIIDFLVRHGFITPDQPGYLDLVRLMRNDDCR